MSGILFIFLMITMFCTFNSLLFVVRFFFYPFRPIGHIIDVINYLIICNAEKNVIMFVPKIINLT